MKPMLAKDAVLDKLSYPLWVQDKLDGIRVVIKDSVALSRTLKPIPNQEIQSALGRPEFNGLDGEIIVGEQTAADCYRRTASFVMAPAKQGEPWTFMVFDKWDSPLPFAGRWFEAAAVVERFDWTDIPIFMLGFRTARDQTDLEAIETASVAAGNEGVIVRGDGPYKFGRSYPKDGTLLKVKRFVDFEAEVVAVYEEMHNGNVAIRNALGRTERSSVKANKTGKGTLGGLVLRTAEGVEFRCGTGFDAADRADLWAEWHVKPFPGRLARIKSFPIGVKDKPRHPVFLGWRHPDDV